MRCKHRFLMVPEFPSAVLMCVKCGKEVNAGYYQGVRDYYLPGDHWGRRHADHLKRSWACGCEDAIYQCPECLFIGSDGDFDCLGADGENFFCNQCSREFDPEPCNSYQIKEPVDGG